MAWNLSRRGGKEDTSVKMTWRRCLIEYKKMKRDKLVDLIIYIAAALAVAVGILLILFLYCRMAGKLEIVWR